MGSQGQYKAKTFLLHFRARCSTDQDEIWCLIEAIQGQHPDTFFLIGFVEIREITAVRMTASKTLNVGVHSDVYKVIYFKLFWW